MVIMIFNRKNVDVAERYEKLRKAGKLGEQWDVFLRNRTLPPEDKWIVVVAEWTTDITENKFSTCCKWERKVDTLIELYGEPENPCTRECLMFCKGVSMTYRQCVVIGCYR